MAGFWNNLFGKRQEEPLSLLDYAQCYLTGFIIATDEKKTIYGAQLLDVADGVARQAGVSGFIDLCETADIAAVASAAMFSKQRFLELQTESIKIKPASSVGSRIEKEQQVINAMALSQIYALTHLMILNNMKSLEDTPRAKKVAEDGAHLYSGAYAVRKMSGNG